MSCMTLVCILLPCGIYGAHIFQYVWTLAEIEMGAGRHG